MGSRCVVRDTPCLKGLDSQQWLSFFYTFTLYTQQKGVIYEESTRRTITPRHSTSGQPDRLRSAALAARLFLWL